MKHKFSIIIAFILVVGVFLLINHDNQEVNAPTNLSEDTSIAYGDISASEAKALIEKNPDIILLDVRTLEEYEEKHIPGAKLLPLSELEERIDELDQDQTYLIYCRSGNRSKLAFNFLESEGFEKLYNLQGGIKNYYN